jgi:hypothetical protein
VAQRACDMGSLGHGISPFTGEGAAISHRRQRALCGCDGSAEFSIGERLPADAPHSIDRMF